MYQLYLHSACNAIDFLLYVIHESITVGIAAVFISNSLLLHIAVFDMWSGLQQYHFLLRPKVNWTEEHDILLCRESVLEEPFKLRFGSRERGKCWDKIAQNLNALGTPSFCVDQRSVRERYIKLEKAFKHRRNVEMRASGISPELNELDAAIEEIVERKESEEENQKRTEESRQEVQHQKETAELVRKRAMETMSQTQDKEGKRKRKSAESNDYLTYFKEKAAMKKKVEDDLLELKKRKVDIEQKRVEIDIQLRQKDLELRERELELKVKSVKGKEGELALIRAKLELMENN